MFSFKYIAQSYEVQLATKAYQNLDWIELNFNYLDSYMNYSNKQKYSKSNRKEHLDSYWITLEDVMNYVD